MPKARLVVKKLLPRRAPAAVLCGLYGCIVCFALALVREQLVGSGQVRKTVGCKVCVNVCA